MGKVKQWSVSELQTILFLGRHKLRRRMFCYPDSPVLHFIKTWLMRKCPWRKQWHQSCKHLQDTWNTLIFRASWQNVLHRLQFKEKKKNLALQRSKTFGHYSLIRYSIQNRKGSWSVEGHYFKNITSSSWHASVWNPTDCSQNMFSMLNKFQSFVFISRTFTLNEQCSCISSNGFICKEVFASFTDCKIVQPPPHKCSSAL